MKLTQKHLLTLLSVPSYSGACDAMVEHITPLLISLGCTVHSDAIGNLYATKGDATTFPCVVAHMDTVHKIETGGIHPVVIGDLITGINPLTMSQTGIGGDDKCGIWCALKTINALSSCKAAFFIDEEVGCVGSSHAQMSFFDDCRFIIQADRRGNKDFVRDISGPLASKKFAKAVSPILKDYGYAPTWGGMTDVMELRDQGVGLSVANLSAGYYNPHCDDEFISITDLENAAALMLAICQLPEVYPYTPAPRPSYYSRDYYGNKMPAKKTPQESAYMEAAWKSWALEKARYDADNDDDDRYTSNRRADSAVEKWERWRAQDAAAASVEPFTL